MFRSTIATLTLALPLLLGAPAAHAATVVMDFEGLSNTGAIYTYDSYTEDGVTVDASVFGGHYDHWVSDSGNHMIAIHNGNNGANIAFDFGGAIVDLISVDLRWLETWWGVDDLTLSSNLGHAVNLDATTFGTYALSSFTGISTLYASMVLPLRPCIPFTGENCTNVGFDNLTYAITTPAPSVPLPAGGVLLLTALGAMVVARKRKS